MGPSFAVGIYMALRRQRQAIKNARKDWRARVFRNDCALASSKDKMEMGIARSRAAKTHGEPSHLERECKRNARTCSHDVA